MRIGQVAKRADVSVQTVRLYEKLGLLKPPRRSTSGYRDYGDDAVRSMRLVKQAQKVGFGLIEIRSLLDLLETDPKTSVEMRRIAESRLQAIDEKIRKLRTMRNAIRHGLRHCTCPEQFPACVVSRLFDKFDRQE